MKQQAVLIVAIVVGIAAFFLTNKYLRDERDKLYAGAEKVKVLAAARDLPAGTVLKFEDLGAKSVYKSAVGENVYRPEHVDVIQGKRLNYGLKKGEPVWGAYVDVPGGGRYGLAPAIQSGLRAISVSVAGFASVSGLVQPNDRVDILGTFSFPSKTQPGENETVTLTVLQDVTVLATGTRMGKQDFMGRESGSGSGSYSTVTLEVTPREAELLVFAQQVKGQLVLSLRNPEDASYVKDMPEVDFKHLETKLPEFNAFRQKNIRDKTDP
jgi:pilus assembly protein CpaB